MNFEKTDVWGFDHAIRGMRNPLESWEKSDSHYTGNGILKGFYLIGENDIKLMKKLISAGTEHRKFLRQIMVSVDISAPIYWFKEFDTYRIGVTENSTSTMHKLTPKPITIDCFEMDDFNCDLPMINCEKVWEVTISYLEALRINYNETKDKRYWKELIRLLPESWLQTRTVTMNYENLLNMVHQRQNHKLSEWSVDFIKWVKSLPYADDLIFSAIETRENEK